MVVLIGSEDIGKSSGVRRTLPPEWAEHWFIDTFALTDGRKELVEKTRAAWMVEIGELAGIRRADLEKVKSTISALDDNGVRTAYERFSGDYPRRFAFAGTANDYGNGVLPFEHDNRRLVVVRIPETSQRRTVFAWVDANREQLWAQALHLVRDASDLTEWLPPDNVLDEQPAAAW